MCQLSNKWIFGALVTCSLLFTEARAECTPFPEIPEERYDRNYSSINDDDKRPLGFLRATVLFNNQEEVDPCFTISNVTGRSVEVKFETVPSMNLCFRDQTGKIRCRQGRFQECLEASDDPMEYTFFCEVSEGCSESDVNFWVRIVRGLPQSEDPEGMWCQWRDNLYPESLATLPPSFTPAPTVPGSVGASTVLTASALLLLMTSAVTSFVTSSVTLARWVKL